MDLKKQSINAALGLLNSVLLLLVFVILTFLAVRTQYVLFKHGYTRYCVNDSTELYDFRVAVFDPNQEDGKKVTVFNRNTIAMYKKEHEWPDSYSFILPMEHARDLNREGLRIDVQNISNERQRIRITSDGSLNSYSCWYEATKKSYQPKYFSVYPGIGSVGRAILFVIIVLTLFYVYLCIGAKKEAANAKQSNPITS